MILLLAPPMSRLLFIGYGSTLRGDDAAGRIAADRLAGALGEEPSLEVLSVPQLTPEVALAVAAAERIYFIDATGAGTPGTWTCQPLAPEANLGNPLGHHYHPAALLAFARALYQATPRAWIVTVTAESFACGETLTPGVEKAVGEIVAFLTKTALALGKPL